jgi:hypothetical protein
MSIKKETTMATKTLQQAEQKAREIVDNWAARAALTGWVPGSALFLAGADLVMARQVADAFGIGAFNEEALGGVIGSATIGGIVGGVIAEGVGWIPIGGWLVKSAMMAGKAKLIGEAVIEFFRDLSPLPA